ncbi:hypothetical protein ACG02S_25875 [Roseateles sp. DC23W]|uniref:Uncharacterized protein n=1 Tax=Pelomonas dachongensis TaxID=3299029 RepID=A0ABW7EV28_9BURK
MVKKMSKQKATQSGGIPKCRSWWQGSGFGERQMQPPKKQPYTSKSEAPRSSVSKGNRFAA